MITVYDRIILELHKLSDKRFKDFNQKIVNSSKPVIGVQVPKLRKIAKTLLKENAQEFLDLCKFDYFEDTMIYGFIIANFSFDNLSKYINIYLSHANSWAHIDSFVGAIKSVENNKAEFIQIIKENIGYSGGFTLRFYIVALMTYYLEDEYLDYVFDICQEYDGKGYYNDMAIAWLISVAYVKFKDKTFDFIKNCKLSSFTLNKAISKIKDSFRVSREDKILLQNYTRKN